MADDQSPPPEPEPPILVKALCIGDSGNGKTGALASLALAGYRIHILDYDCKMKSANTLKSALEDNPEAWARVRWRSISDKRGFVNGKPVLKQPCLAYRQFGRTLEEWDVNGMGPGDVLVIDTLTSLADAAFNEACSIANRMSRQADGSDRPRLQEFGWMADSLKVALEMVTEDFPCHAIVNAHVKIMAPEDEELMMETNKAGQAEEAYTRAVGQPNARGKEIPRIAMRYFNDVFYFTRQGPKRVISTTPTSIVDTKTSRLKNIKPHYPIETGLAELFRTLGASTVAAHASANHDGETSPPSKGE
jgi:hypothetical protein